MYPSQQNNDPSTSHYPQQDPGGYFGNPNPPTTQMPTPSATPGTTSSYPAPPYSAQPHSAAPQSGVPYSGVPHSGGPYSGQAQPTEPFGGGQPTEPFGGAQPTQPFGSPQPTDPFGSRQQTDPFGSPQPTETPTPQRGKAVPILSALTAILLVALAITGGFFISHKNESDKTIADQKAQITKLQSDLDAKSKQLTRKSDELDKAEACMKAVRAFFRAVNANNRLAASRAVLVIDRDCEGVNLR